MVARTLDVRLEVFKQPVGLLTSTINGDTSFKYTDQYLALGNKVPLSLSLPLQPEPFGDVQTRAFFDNLLPENDLLNRTMEREGIPRADIVSLLYHLGADCPGAISCIPQGDGAIKIPGVISSDYDVLQDENLIEIARRLADREPLPNELRDPSPLAGVQRKIALTQLQDGRFGVPKAKLRVPTTHILKVPRRNKRRESRLEAAAALLAETVGLEVAIPLVLELGDVTTLLVPRFDRVTDAHGTIRRVHQEDFAQALGLPSGLKYERYGTDSRRFSAAGVAALLDQTADPALSKRVFLAATIFNMIVGNTDNHAKNHALIYKERSTPALAPLYDILPVRLDSSVDHDFSFYLGGAKKFDVMTKDDLMAFFKLFGLSIGASNRFISEVIAPMLSEIDEASRNFTKQNLKDFDDLIGREAARLSELLGLKVSLRDHDYFPAAGR